MNIQRFEAILRRAILLPLVGLMLLSCLFAWQIYRLQHAMAAVDRSDRVLTEASRFLRHAVDEETGLRGYQATGDPLFLRPKNEGGQEVPHNFALLKFNLQGNPAQLARLDAVRSAYDRWQGFMDRVLVLSRAGGDVRGVALNLEGKNDMDALRTRVQDLVENESASRDQMSEGTRNFVRRLTLICIVAALLAGILLGAYTRREMQEISRAYRRWLDTAEKRADALHASEQWLWTILRSIGDAVITCDRNGNVEFMNPVAETLCGWKHEDAQGQELGKVFDIVNEQTRQPVENPVDKVRRLNTVVGLANHTILLSHDGQEYNIDDSGAPIRKASGEMEGIVLTFRDITEQRRAENAVIANEKLAVAGRLAASIAHEIHNPLDSVSNLLYLLSLETTSNPTYIELARQELGRVTQISRAMLSVYRESKTPVPADLKDLMEGVLILLDRKLRDNLLQIETDLQSVTVECFPSELRQIFINLVGNAAEASNKGAQIRIRITSVEPNRLTALPLGGARVEIMDDGPGIPAEVREKLFTPFFTTKGDEGTGLGLWLSRSMVEKHGGHILLKSSMDLKDHGTTFTVLLPARVMQVPMMQASA